MCCRSVACARESCRSRWPYRQPLRRCSPSVPPFLAVRFGAPAPPCLRLHLSVQPAPTCHSVCVSSLSSPHDWLLSPVHTLPRSPCGALIGCSSPGSFHLPLRPPPSFALYSLPLPSSACALSPSPSAVLRCCSSSLQMATCLVLHAWTTSPAPARVVTTNS